MPRRRPFAPLVLAVAVAAVLPLGPAVAFAAPADSAVSPGTPCATAPAAVTGPTQVRAADGRPLPPNVAAFMRAYEAWGAAASVPGYMELFTPTGTLMDTGLPEPIGHEAIRAQMESLLKEVPNYTFDPLSVVASRDGKVAFVTARNTGKLARTGVCFDYITTHRLVLDGERVEQGRRFWDQTELFRPLAPELRNLFAGLTPTPPSVPRTTDRKQAWNTRDTAALIAGVDGPVRLTGPGLDAPLTGRAAARSYLDRLFSEVHSLRLEPGHTVRRGAVTYREWVGHAVVGPERREVTYGISERFTRERDGGTSWHLAFETLDLVATEKDIRDLRLLLFPRTTG
ncbi:nuclear transport factor 2 family protein [Streptomyces sp. NPDC000594]|uniref:nuclear transport factor 2 family protein n=1 Tax=Streptomyces sp. NPDC000594 TaxID=3154261 RepID=UPI0033190142